MKIVLHFFSKNKVIWVVNNISMFGGAIALNLGLKYRGGMSTMKDEQDNGSFFNYPDPISSFLSIQMKACP